MQKYAVWDTVLENCNVVTVKIMIGALLFHNNIYIYIYCEAHLHFQWLKNI